MVLSKCRQIGHRDHLTVGLRSISPHHFGELERERPLDVGGDGALAAAALHRVGRDQDLAGGDEVVALLHGVDDRRPVVERGRAVGLDVVHRIVGVEVVARPVLVRFRDGRHELGLRRFVRDPVVDVIPERDAPIFAQPRLGSIDVHAPSPAEAAIRIVLEERLVFEPERKPGRTFRVRVRHEKDHVLAVGHLDHVHRAADVIELSVLRMVFDERLRRTAAGQPIHRMGLQEIVVRRELILGSGARDAEQFLVRHHEEILRRLQPRHLVVELQPLQA